MSVNRNAIAAAVFLPLLYWSGAVIGISWLGFPGVAWMTPAAWLLAVPLGVRLARQSSSPPAVLRRESLAAGGLLGLGQGFLVAAAMGISRLVNNYGVALPRSWELALLAVVLSTLVCAALAAITTQRTRLKMER